MEDKSKYSYITMYNITDNKTRCKHNLLLIEYSDSVKKSYQVLSTSILGISEIIFISG